MSVVEIAARRLACGVVALAIAANLVPAASAMAAESSEDSGFESPVSGSRAPKDSVSMEASLLASRALGQPTDAVTQAFWRWPVPGIGIDHISQGVTEEPGYRHYGIDIWGDRGTPIVASRSGYVSSDETTNALDGYGTCVVVYHGDGTSTYYAHMDSRIVSDGDYVEQGQVLGYMGDTGDAWGVHLHFEIRVDTTEDWVWGTPIDPQPFVNGHDYDGGGNQGGQGPSEPSGDNDFLDVDYSDESCWYASVVREAYEMGLMVGVGSGEYFMPEVDVTRGQVLTILWRAALGDAAVGVDTSRVENATPFADNRSGQYYTAAVNWAYSNGIVNGHNGSVTPDSPVSRQDLAILMANYARFVEGGQPSASLGALNGFVDSENIGDWARPSVAWCVENGVMSGTPLSTGEVAFDPEGTATRAQMAKVAVMTVRALQ